MAAFTPIFAVIGPTASGKSALALDVAIRANAEILSVDSMQVYRQMNVGTAKPTPAEQARTKHHLIDIVDPNERFAVSRFVDLATEVIRDAQRRGVPLVAAGGTPMYFKSLFEGIFEGPGADADLRARLATETNELLHERLTRVDPVSASRIHTNDTRRIIRALEVFELTGKAISSLQTDWSTGRTRFDVLWVGLNWDRDALNVRINARAKRMLAEGWLEEARGLRERFGALSPTAQEAAGYRFLFDHLDGRISLDDAVEQIKISTRQLARAQMKWFRRFQNVSWLAGDGNFAENAARSVELWRRPDKG